ncbi:hypothetical protein Vafri_265 [Volvox africanus]|nr:hypothetical protein Vafri_265 [Volvox africanus]
MSDYARALTRGPFRPLLLAVAAEGLRLAFRLGMGAGGPGQLVARTGKVFDHCPTAWIVAPGVSWLRRSVAAQQGPGSIAQGTRTAAVLDVLEVQLVRIHLSAVRS